MCESSGRFIRQRSTAATAKWGPVVSATPRVRGEVEAHWTAAGSKLDHLQKLTARYAPTQRDATRHDATRRCRRERRRVLLIDDYEAFTRECIKKGTLSCDVRYTRRLDASRRDATRVSRLTWRVKYKARRGARVRRWDRARRPPLFYVGVRSREIIRPLLFALIDYDVFEIRGNKGINRQRYFLYIIARDASLMLLL